MTFPDALPYGPDRASSNWGKQLDSAEQARLEAYNETLASELGKGTPRPDAERTAKRVADIAYSSCFPSK